MDTRSLENISNHRDIKSMSENTAQVFKLLVVDDNPSDVILTIEAFKDSAFEDNISVAVANDGEQAMAMLLKTQDYIDFELPNLILLDLNMPGLGGHEVLEKIKSNEALRRIPVIIMSSSKTNQDVQNSYDLHANSYIVKPTTLAQYSEVVAKVESFWLDAASLPNK